MNNSIQCSLESSTTKMDLNSASDGIYLIPDLEGLVGLPEIRTTSGVNAGYDGGWTSAQNYDARLISIRGVIANPDVAQVEALRRKLASLVGQGHKEQLTLRIVTEAGNAYAISVRTISCEMALQRVLTKQEFLIQLRADDPLIYDDGASSGTEAVLHVQQALGGFEINFELPLAIGGGDENVTIENGAEMTYPLITLTGPLHSPTVVNITTNQQMQILADLIGDGQEWANPIELTGESITINDVIEDAPMTIKKIEGNATQANYMSPNIFNRATATEDVGLIWANGNTTSTTNAVSSDYIAVSANEKIWMNYNAMIMFYNSSKAYLGALQSDGTYAKQQGVIKSNFTVTNNSSVAYMRLGFRPVNNNSENMKAKTDIMVNKGDALLPYEAYGQAPNPLNPQAIKTVSGTQTLTIDDGDGNSKTVTIGLKSKNLAWSGWADNFVTRINDSTKAEILTKDTRNCLKWSANAGYGDYSNKYMLTIDWQANKQYTFSFDIYTENPSNRCNLAIEYTDGTTTLIDNTYGAVKDEWKHITFTSASGKTVKYLRAHYWSGDCYLDIDTFQLEQGATETAYQEPFNYELAKIGDVTDYIWKDGDDWKIHKAISKSIIDGTESNWGYNSTYKVFWTNCFNIMPDIPSSTNGYFAKMCDHFIYHASSGNNASLADGLYENNSPTNLAQALFHYASITSLEDWKTWLGNNNLVIYYEKVTATDTTITDATLISQLETVSQLYEGDNTITITPASGATGTLTIEYMSELIGNVADKVVIDSQARTITLNGQDAYHLKADGSEFITLAPGDNTMYLTSAQTSDTGYAEVKFKQGHLTI